MTSPANGTTAAARATLEPHAHTFACSQCGEVDQVLVGPDGRPTALGWRKIGEALGKPMVTWQARKTGGTYQYLKPRQIEDRLDAVVGPGNWATDWECLRSEAPVAVRFGLAIFGVWKWDAGYSNNPEADEEDKAFEYEPLKAAVTDGLKRVAVQWGIGRWLKAGAPS